MKKIAYVGIDCHINLLSIAVVIEGEKELYETIRLSNNDRVIIRYMKKLSKNFQIKAYYEASSSGYPFLRVSTLRPENSIQQQMLDS